LPFNAVAAQRRIDLTGWRDFSKVGVAKADLNQAEDISLPGSSPLPDLHLAEPTRRRNRKEISYATTDSAKKSNFTIPHTTGLRLVWPIGKSASD
jgi:hypothetical protein